jgi:hypothetical protein
MLCLELLAVGRELLKLAHDIDFDIAVDIFLGYNLMRYPCPI